MAIEVSAQNPRSCKALALFARCAEWQTGRRKSDGRSFFLIPGSNGAAYYVDANECTCPDFVRRGAICKHQTAVRLWLAAFQTGQVRPRGRTADSADDTLAVLLPTGAAYLVSQERPAPSVAATADTLDALVHQRQERARDLRLRGYTPDEYEEDATYRQLVAQIARLEARAVAAVA